MQSFKEIQISVKQKVAGKIVTFLRMCTKRAKIKTDNLQNNFESEIKLLINPKVNQKFEAVHKKYVVKTS